MRIAARKRDMNFLIRKRSTVIIDPTINRNLLFTCNNHQVYVTLRDIATGRIESSRRWNSDPLDQSILIEEGSRLTAEMAALRIIEIIRSDQQPQGNP